MTKEEAWARLVAEVEENPWGDGYKIATGKMTHSAIDHGAMGRGQKAVSTRTPACVDWPACGGSPSIYSGGAPSCHPKPPP